ncbi:MAG TPA: hypothetical protein VHO66_01260, partial [Ruminiclostridium sp.]|nr:hypothetical protein [Ruminiclostridium sp.]
MFRRFSVNFAIFSMLVDAFCVVFGLLSSIPLRWELNELSFVRQLGEPYQPPLDLFLIFPTV